MGKPWHSALPKTHPNSTSTFLVSPSERARDGGDGGDGGIANNMIAGGLEESEVQVQEALIQNTSQINVACLIRSANPLTATGKGRDPRSPGLGWCQPHVNHPSHRLKDVFPLDVEIIREVQKKPCRVHGWLWCPWDEAIHLNFGWLFSEAYWVCDWSSNKA